MSGALSKGQVDVITVLIALYHYVILAQAAVNRAVRLVAESKGRIDTKRTADTLAPVNLRRYCKTLTFHYSKNSSLH